MKCDFDINKLKFDEKGLIPAIVTDNITKEVLTLAYMNRESLEKSIEKGLTCFWSRSRNELWTKGETSGNYQHIVSITADCDCDALNVIVEKKTALRATRVVKSCFTNTVCHDDNMTEFSLSVLMNLLLDRKKEMKEGSYTTYLFEKGLDKILKKVGEESTEVIIAAKAEDKKETIYEIADLCYHVFGAYGAHWNKPKDIQYELASRNVIDHKVKQEKMTK
ncbi:MAG: bifunctional phosphoribosyl-AMP cyclohydrolase/phosphoribosyl-ATP diphosphatase HisIE [Clostridiales bacterium]|nr:MAG: bifunctional phosphoribosyl-AMP cyclohydrolase/phosphoribosyl-ATP diphosphatase HisIE [Clostridiales bacterium]